MTDTPSRPGAFLLTLNPDHITPMGERPLDLSTVARDLKGTAQRLSMMASGKVSSDFIKPLRIGTNEPHTLAVGLDDAALEDLRKRYGDALIIEPDHDLDLFGGPAGMMPGGGASDLQSAGPRNFFTQGSSALILEITVKGNDGKPVAFAEVTGRGSAPFSLDNAVTDAKGMAELSFFGDTPTTLRELRVNPSRDYWGRIITRPDLTGFPKLAGKLQVTLTLERLGAGEDEQDVWGYQAMALPKADGFAANTLAPVKIAIIDSGIAAAHEDLEPAGGRDFTDRGGDETLWREDSIGHGTHVAGTCGAIFNGRGICGAAGPDAALYGLSVFPGGRTSSLIRALDWCVENEIDIANMSLGSAAGTAALQAAVIRATEAGVCLVAAAGNSGAGVMYPAAYAQVIAVAALGADATFPPDSPHRDQRGAHQAGRYFAAAFTCHGPQIDMAAPGVAVISCVPSEEGAAYAAWDGTSMAAPYVAGFAARLLRLRTELRAQGGAARVAALKAALLECCTDLGLPAELQGRGMPLWRMVPDAPAQTASVIERLEKVSHELSRELT
ncbi:MAG: hypothetical protein EA339_13475 [Rhodobacteraceae bacterium]|nr:MAG: hypothetical protein EA339_13475 [Paracoccaceae bacterium]